MENEKMIPCEVYSRVSGYYRRVEQWNAGKQEEFYERKMIKIPIDITGGSGGKRQREEFSI